jgi:hypothetical protein
MLHNKTFTGELNISHSLTPLMGSAGCIYNSGGITFPSTPNNSITVLTTSKSNIIMQNKVAVFKVTRDENNKITSTEFIKELWVETKNGSTVDFQVARDKDLENYQSHELVIKTISTVTF